MADDLIERLNETVRLHTELAKSGEAYDGFELRAFADEAKEAADALSSKDAALSEIRAELDLERAATAFYVDRSNELDASLEAAESQLEMARKALAFADKQSAKVEALLEPHVEWEPGTIRICPMRDGPCPHGMKCPFVGEGYHGYPCKEGWKSARALAEETK